MRGPLRRSFLLLAGLLATAGLASADTLDGSLQIESAYVTVDGGVYRLNAVIRFPLNEEIHAALKEGVSLRFNVETVIVRERRYWFDDSIVGLAIEKELSYHSVSDRYVVRDLRNSDQASFVSLEDAVDAIGRIENRPILVEPQLDASASYRVSVRAGVRRGRVPDALRFFVFWSDSWHRESDWYSWTLPH
ncbi:MAG: DUF4390 domain-containing protein [Steroidobacteraceae bacterium]